MKSLPERPHQDPPGLHHVSVGQSNDLMLLMHGGPGPDHSYLRPWLDGLSEDLKLVFYDHRGGGQSRSRPLDPPMTYESLSADAEAIRLAYTDRPIVVFGHSFGGMVAMDYALRFPDSVRGLILCCTAARWDYRPVRRANAVARGGDDAAAVLDRYSRSPAEDDEALRRTWVALQPLYFHRPHPDLIRGWAATVSFSAAAFNRSEILLEDFYLVDRLARIQAPTLVVAGRDDWVTPLEQSIDIYEGIPRSTLAVFDRSGHYPFIEEQDAFLRSVRSWLRGLGLWNARLRQARDEEVADS